MTAVRLTLRTEPGSIDIRRQPPALEISRTAPRVRVERRDPQVTLDRTEYRDAVGVLLPVALVSRFAGQARSAAAEAIGRISAEGDTLMRIENPGGTIASIAATRLDDPPVEVELRKMPPARFRVADPGGVTTEGQPGTLTIRAQLTPVSIEVRPAKVVADTEVPPKVNVTA